MRWRRIIWADTRDYVTGMVEHFNEKEEQYRQRDQRYSEHVHDLGGYRHILDFVKYHEAKGTSHVTW